MSISLVRLVVFVNLRGVLILTTNLLAIWSSSEARCSVRCLEALIALLPWLISGESAVKILT